MRSSRGGSQLQNRLVVALGVLAIALALAAFVGPWWVSSWIPDRLPVATLAFGPFDWTYTGATITSNGPMTYRDNYTNARQIGALLLPGAALVAAGLVPGIGMVAAVTVTGSRPRFRAQAAVLGILASSLMLAAVVAVMLLLPAAANQALANGSSFFTGFWGSAPSFNHEYGEFLDAWGAGWAWYAVLAASLLFLIDAITLVRAKMPTAAPAAPKATQQP